MKRSPELAPLSRDHHHALDAARRLRRADAGDVDAAVAHFLAFWRRDGQRHVQIEEDWLLPALPSDDQAWSAAVQRVRHDHKEIRARAATLDRHVGSAAADAARALGTLLQDHVRFEERQLFALLEERLTSRELAQLGRAVEAAERNSGEP